MADDLVTLSADQRTALQIVFDVFHEQATWPTVQYVDYELDQKGLASAEVLASLPMEVAQFDRRPGASGSIALTVLGISQCDGAERELDLFLRAVQWCAEKERGFRPSPTENEQLKLTSSDFAEHVGDLSRNDLVQVAELFRQEWRLRTGLGGPNMDEPTWSLWLNEGIRPYRGVASLADYLAISQRAAAEQETMVGVPVHPVAAEPAMTLSANHSDDLGLLHPIVRDAARALFAISHYREGVLKAADALRDLVRRKSGLIEPDDSTLMGRAFSLKDPKIVIADLETETGRNIQRGTMYLAQGIVARLRNPLTHEIVELDYVEAVEMLAIISRVARDVDAAVVRGDTAPEDDGVTEDVASSGHAASTDAP